MAFKGTILGNFPFLGPLNAIYLSATQSPKKPGMTPAIEHRKRYQRWVKVTLMEESVCSLTEKV